jgi:hypothetical protein
MIRLKVRKIGNSLGVMLAVSDEEVDRRMQNASGLNRARSRRDHLTTTPQAENP